MTKSIKKNNKKKTNNVSKEIYSIVKLLVIVLVILGIFYFLTVYITSKKENKYVKEEKTGNVDISYQEILAGSSFNIDEEEYIVIYYDMSDKDLKSNITTSISKYESKEKHLPIYTVNMSSAFNKKYNSSESNNNPSSLEELSISGPTLIKFSNNEVNEYIESYDNIKEYLD
ncbi:MAG: hypothetical protein IJF92_03055 [Bacilli bacterium]|nr:hypothetical protein [Bacilli bacterium]